METCERSLVDIHPDIGGNDRPGYSQTGNVDIKREIWTMKLPFVGWLRMLWIAVHMYVEAAEKWVDRRKGIKPNVGIITDVCHGDTTAPIAIAK